jgi:hypothetical protein
VSIVFCRWRVINISRKAAVFAPKIDDILKHDTSELLTAKINTLLL